MLACADSEDTNADGGTTYFNESGIPYDAGGDAKADHFLGPETSPPYDATADAQTDAQDDAGDAGDE